MEPVSFRVMAQLHGPDTRYHQVEWTTKRDYAETLVEQFRDANVPVRLEEICPPARDRTRTKFD